MFIAICSGSGSATPVLHLHSQILWPHLSLRMIKFYRLEIFQFSQKECTRGCLLCIQDNDDDDYDDDDVDDDVDDEHVW